MANGHRTRLLMATLLFWATASHLKTLGQDGREYLSIGSDHSGLCFGNALRYNGARLGFNDSSSVVNGINMSLLSRIGSMNGLRLGLAKSTSGTTNGISVNGLVDHSIRTNGLAITTLNLESRKLNGLGIAVAISVDTLNGFAAGVGIGPPFHDIQGTVLNGLIVGLGIEAERTNGLMVALVSSSATKHCGVSVAGYNKATELHGFQFGLLNYAGNNPKLLRWLPILNFHP
jgi:hypothetical protein